MIGKYRATFGLAQLARAPVGTHDARARLRAQLAKIHGVRHVVLFRSAREGVQALLRALAPTGSAVVPAYNCIAVPETVEAAGWRPLLADVAAGDVNADCASIAASVASDTKAVFLTHQFGIPSQVDEIVGFCRQRNLFVIEDAAAALGAKYRGRPAGSLGDAAAVSFHLSKIVGTGRAGAILTGDEGLAARVHALCNAPPRALDSLTDFVRASAWWTATTPTNYGVVRRLWTLFRRESLHEVVAPQPRPQDAFRPCSNFAASLAELQLRELDANVAQRKLLADFYAVTLSGVQGIGLCPVAPGAEPSWMQFPVFVQRKEECYRYMLRHGVDLSWTFRYSCGSSYGAAGTEWADRASRELLGLPTYPALPLDGARRICSLLVSFFKGSTA